jgi:transposase-like protein
MASERRRAPYPAEMCERAVRLVCEHEGDHASRAAAVHSVARIGRLPPRDAAALAAGRAERDDGVRPSPTSEERDRIRQLEREVRELRQANEILRKASAYFAQAELDRPPQR